VTNTVSFRTLSGGMIRNYNRASYHEIFFDRGPLKAKTESEGRVASSPPIHPESAQSDQLG
jgi:hypothetical protein